MVENNNNNNQHRGSISETERGAVHIPPSAYAQLEALRASGVVNMATEVIEGLDYFEFDEARAWIQSNPEKYVHSLSVGLTTTDPGSVPEIDPADLRSAVQTPDLERRKDASTVGEQRILDYLWGVRGVSGEAVEYYRDGSLRNTGRLSDSQRELALAISETITPLPNRAYRNALVAVASLGDKYPLTYAEGYVLRDKGRSPIAHAWVESEGDVLEVTFPEGPETSDEDVYFGKPFSLKAVRQTLAKQAAEPIAGETTTK